MKAGAWLFVAIGAAVLAALFMVMRPQPQPPAPAPTAAAPTAPQPAAVAAPAFATHEVLIELRDGQRVAGPDVIRVQQDDVLLLSIVSDRADELHIHGYDLQLPIGPEAPAVLRLKADRSGRFDFELHHAHAELGVIEVMPR